MVKQVLNLADVETRWSLIFQAQKTKGDEAARARGDLLSRYHGAVQSYLRRALGPRHEFDADILYSNFAVRILELDPLLKRVKKLKGKSFRSYLRTVLWRMVKDYYRRTSKDEPFIEGSEDDMERDKDAFDTCWRQELINQTWKALEQMDKRAGKLYVLLLQMQQEHPRATYNQLAELISQKEGQAFTAANVRQLVHRGRDLFGDLLVREAALSLSGESKSPVSVEKLEEELIDLKLLLKYTRPALERYAKEKS